MNNGREINQPAKVQAIIDSLRHRILSGDFSLGVKLPTRIELTKEYGASSVTLQAAIDLLVKEKFLMGVVGRGTYVTDILPCDRQYAMVFPVARTPGTFWPIFWQVLERQAETAREELGRNITLYSGKDDQRLLGQHIREGRIGGLILVGPLAMTMPHYEEGQPSVPAVAFSSIDREYRAVSQVIPVIFQNILPQALDSLKEKGCQRVAVITPAETLDKASPFIERETTSRGMICPSYWRQGVPLSQPNNAVHVVELLLKAEAKDRPAGLVIMDDNFIPAVTKGILACAVRVPADLHVIAHSNLPIPATHLSPFPRIGPDLRRGMRNIIQTLDAMRRGETAESILLHTRFEQDLACSSESLMTPLHFGDSFGSFETNPCSFAL